MKPSERLDTLRRLVRGWLPREPVRAASSGRKTLAGRTVLTALVIVVVLLASFAVYQQIQITHLSSSISQQSSEFYHPSASVAISRFTVTQENATSEPQLYLVVTDNGSLPVESGTLTYVMMYGENSSINSCYSGTQSISNLHTNESESLIAPLTCGQLGDTVVLTLQVAFTSNSGTMTKIYTDKTTVNQSQAIKLETVALKGIGIRTYVIPEIFPEGTKYQWSLALTNEGRTSISGVNATLSWEGRAEANISGCVLFGGTGLYSVNAKTPLPPMAKCNGMQDLAGTGPFAVGQMFDVSISLTYTNGTASTVSSAAVMEPPYAIVG